MQNTSAPAVAPQQQPQQELLTQYASQQPQATRPVQRGVDPVQIGTYLQQQGVLPSSMNLNDPNNQATVLTLLHQFGSAQTAGWGGNSQSSNQQNLEQLLAQISRTPELAANLPQLFNLTGGLGAQQHLNVKDGSSAQEDATGNTYTAQLYGNPNAGLSADGELKGDPSGDLGQDMGDDPKANSVKCAKEKNRQAQRRFRERQKGLISQLKDRADTLQKQVEEQRRTIESLEKENQVLKVILQEKNKV